MSEKEKQLKVFRAIAQHGNNLTYEELVKYSGLSDSDTRQTVDELISGGYLDCQDKQ